MGDRVSVTLSVPTALADLAEAIMIEQDGSPSSAEEFDDHTAYEFDEVNYGNLACEKYLTAAGIAWMKSWGRGGGYNPGMAWAMFREDGTLHKIELQDAAPEDILGPFINLINEPNALVEALTIERDKLTPPSWDNQAEYGKRYQTRQLIDPPQAVTNPCAEIELNVYGALRAP